MVITPAAPSIPSGRQSLRHSGMNVAFCEPFRACRLCWVFDDGCVLADFDVDAANGEL